MTDSLRRKLKEEMADLPSETIEAIDNFNWESIVERAGKKHSLTEDEINNLQIEVGLVLVALAFEDSLVYNIENEVGTTKKEAQELTEEITQKIFKPIKNIIVKKIKAGLKNKNQTWKQNVEFVLSGGDYTVFQEFPEQPAENPEPAAKIDASFITKKFNI